MWMKQHSTGHWCGWSSTPEATGVDEAALHRPLVWMKQHSTGHWSGWSSTLQATGVDEAAIHRPLVWMKQHSTGFNSGASRQSLVNPHDIIWSENLFQRVDAPSYSYITLSSVHWWTAFPIIPVAYDTTFAPSIHPNLVWGYGELCYTFAPSIHPNLVWGYDELSIPIPVLPYSERCDHTSATLCDLLYPSIHNEMSFVALGICLILSIEAYSSRA